MAGHIRFKNGQVVIDEYDAAAKTISGHFSASGKDDDGNESDIGDGAFFRNFGQPTVKYRPTKQAK